MAYETDTVVTGDPTNEVRGRSERVFSTHQDRLVKESALVGITDTAAFHI